MHSVGLLGITPAPPACHSGGGTTPAKSRSTPFQSTLIENFAIFYTFYLCIQVAMTSEGVSDRNWPILVHVWSGPRCLSTSLMYSFAQRADVGRVEDEPLYAAYLNTHPDVARPPGYRELVLQSQNTDASAVAASILEYSNPEKPILYAKHMAKQRAGAPRSLLASGRHALLVRRPEAVVASFSEVTAPDLHETCLPALLELYSEIRTLTGYVERAENLSFHSFGRFFLISIFSNITLQYPTTDYLIRRSHC